MNKLKNIGLGILAIASVSFSSCSSSFLDEHLDTKYSTDYFETPEGLEALAISLYGNIRWHSLMNGPMESLCMVRMSLPMRMT